VQARTIALIGVLAWSGCASLSGSKDQFFVCSYDVVWDAALASVNDRPIQVQDKDKGLIETGWIEMEGTERGYGAFDREGFGNRERARMTVAVRGLNDVTSVSVLENRQRWHLKGGATQQSTKWWPIDPSEEAEATVVNRLNNKLKKKGCIAS
jgi:NlpB/DapX lipoprotein